MDFRCNAYVEKCLLLKYKSPAVSLILKAHRLYMCSRPEYISLTVNNVSPEKYCCPAGKHPGACKAWARGASYIGRWLATARHDLKRIRIMKTMETGFGANQRSVANAYRATHSPK